MALKALAPLRGGRPHFKRTRKPITYFFLYPTLNGRLVVSSDLAHDPGKSLEERRVVALSLLTGTYILHSSVLAFRT